MKQYILTIIAVISLSTLAGCGSISSPDTAELPATSTSQALSRTPTREPTATEVVTQGTVSIWHSWDDPQIPALLRTIDAFGEVYPNVHFDVLYVPSLDLRASFEQAAINGGGPTILIGPADWGAELYNEGLVADVQDFVGAELIDTLNPAAVGAARYRDKMIGLPLNIDGVVLFRNNNLVLSSPATFEELINIANSTSEGEILGAYLDRSFFMGGGHLNGLGGSLMTPEGDPAFNDEKGVEWIELLKSFEEAGPTDYFSDDDVNLFKEGLVGFIVEGTWRRQELAEAIGESNLSIVTWPIHAGGALSGYVRAENVFLTPRAMDEEHLVSQKFVEFMLSPESQTELAEVGLIPSINGSPTNLVVGKMNVTDRLIRQAMLALVDGTTYPVIPEMSAYIAPMDIALKSVFFEGANPSEALKTAEGTIRMTLAALRSTPTPSP
ncbi:MAG: extracellular solute-binding protein [Anaerolineales bacterium]